MENQKFKSETSIDGIKWHFVAGFIEGEQSRFNKPIDANTMIKEAKSYIDYCRRSNRVLPFKHIRIIIDIEITES